MKKKKVFFATAMMAMAMVFAGCSSSSGSDTIKLGVNLELTGDASSYGNMELNGVKLAVKQINDAGGIDGKKIEIVQYDNKSDAPTAVQNQTRLVTDDKVVAVVGPATSGLAKAVTPVSNDNGVPVIFASATADGVTNDGSKAYAEAFRICFGDSFQGITMANFASNKLNAKTAVILRDTNDYGTGLAVNFTKQFKANGGTILKEEVFNTKDTDFNSVLTNIKNLGAFDVLFVPGYYSEAGLIINQARTLGINATVLGADGFESDKLVELATAPSLNNVYYSTHYSTLGENTTLQDFIKAYATEYNENPNAFNALGYDAAKLAMDAIQRAGKVDSAAVTTALNETKDFAGVTGTISISALHDAVKSAYVVGLENGVATTAVLVNP